MLGVSPTFAIMGGVIMEVEEIQICKINRGKVNFPSLTEELELLKTENADDLLIVLNECVTKRQPAWYISIPPKRKSMVRVTMTNSGKKSFKEVLAQSYIQKREENLALMNEFKWVDSEADEFIPEER